MSQYTQQLHNIQYEISIEDDDYVQKLEAVLSLFRDFDEALDNFLITKGYNGDITDIDQKVEFIKQKCKEANITNIPRNMKKWFSDKVRIRKRTTMFQLCFAFSLNLEECDAFFRNVCLERSFDCHYIEEAIYYYAIVHGYSYDHALSLIQQAPSDNKGNLPTHSEVLYTNSIIKEIHRIQSDEELLLFFHQNQKQFGYNNASAYRYIMNLWEQIFKEDGFADQELQFLFSKSICEEVELKKRSNWTTYLQILGLYDFDEDLTPLFVLDTERSIQSILKDNCLLHPLAQASFPERQGLEAILRGEHKSHELVRKTLILLSFYKYWTNDLIKHNGKNCSVEKESGKRCYAQMNRYLLDAGYPTLYAGNPYDWIFLYAMQDAYPMETFRYFIRELYLHKELDACI